MIKRIKIRDFKSIRELDLELDPVTVLVGRSGTGKSNIVQAIRFLRNVLLNVEQAVNYEYGWERIIPVGEQVPRTSIEVFFSVPGEDQDFRYKISFRRRPGQSSPMLRSEELDFGDETVFSRLYPDVVSGHADRRHWEWEVAPKLTTEPSPSDDAPMLGKFPSLQKAVWAYAALSAGIGYYHFPATTLHRLKQVSESNGELFKYLTGLSDSANNYIETIQGITKDFHHPNLRKNLLATLKQVNPSIESVELDSLNSPQAVVVGHRTSRGIFDLRLEQESDGLRRFYAHLLALYQPQPKLVLVFEEPENAIFPGALSLLADEFKAAPRENRGQVILTTHSPTLLNSFDVENVRAVEMRDGKTVVGPVAKEQRDAVKDHLLSTGELLTIEQPKIEEPAAQNVA